MKERTYDCPDCGNVMQVLGWTVDMKTVACSVWGQEMAARNHPIEQSLTEFLKA